MTQRLRADLRQFLSGLRPQTGYPSVIEFRGNLAILQGSKPFRFGFLSIDIAGVFEDDFHLLDHLLVEVQSGVWKVRLPDLRPLENLRQRVLSHFRSFKTFDFCSDSVLSFQHRYDGGIVNSSNSMANLTEPLIGVVLPEE